MLLLEFSGCGVSRTTTGGSGCSSTSFSFSRDFCFFNSTVPTVDGSKTGSFVTLIWLSPACDKSLELSLECNDCSFSLWLGELFCEALLEGGKRGFGAAVASGDGGPFLSPFSVTLALLLSEVAGGCWGFSVMPLAGSLFTVVASTSTVTSTELGRVVSETVLSSSTGVETA